MSVTNDRLLELREQFADELEQAMYQGPQWQKGPREMLELVDELLALRNSRDALAIQFAAAKATNDEGVREVGRLLEALESAESLLERIWQCELHLSQVLPAITEWRDGRALCAKKESL